MFFPSVEEGGDTVIDAPARKPKPFLKRGEGVNKRLNAYKFRGEAEVLRKERASSSYSIREPCPRTSDQYAHDNSASSQPKQQQRRTWQQPVQQHRSDHAADEVPLPARGQHNTAAGKQPTAAASEQASYGAPHQAVEDLELEEFRALEREILGDGGHATAHKSSTGQWQPPPLQQQQPQSQPHRQQDQAVLDEQWHLQQQEEEADRQYACIDEQPEQEQAEQQDQLQNHQLQHSGYAARAAAAAGQRAGLDHSINLQDMNLNMGMRFQDDTEWVDTEFSFADLSLEAQQDQTRAAGQNKARLQQHPHLQQQQAVQQAELQGVVDTGGPLSQQPYVRSIFRQQQQQQQGRPISSNGRLDTAAAAGKKGARSGRSPARTAAAAAAAAAGTAGAGEDVEQELVAVPAAAAAARWQQLETAQGGLHQEKAALRKMRQELEKAAQQLELQRAAWERDRAAQQANFEAWKAEETKQLANRRRVLDQQYKAMYKMPTKKDKTALEAIEAALEREKAEAKAAAARHKLTVERLRCRVKTLEDSNHELREEARWLGAQQLNNTDFAVKDKARKRPTSSAQTQTDPVLSAPARVSDHLGRQADAWAAAATAAAGGAAAAAATTSNPLYEALFGDDEDDDAASSEAASRHQQHQHQTQHQWQQEQQQGSWDRAGDTQLALQHAGSSNGARGSDAQWPGQPMGAQYNTDNTQPAQHAQRREDFSFDQSSPGQHHQQQSMAVYPTAHSSSPASGTAAVAAATAAHGAGNRTRSSGCSNGRSSVSSQQQHHQQQQQGIRREVLKWYEYPDGKVEQLFDDGTREVHYRNGSSQVYRADGSVLLYFGNGDVKRQWPGGRVDYYYAEVAVWQCTHPDGLNVFHYPSGQVEGHFADGRKEVIFADGMARIVQDGAESDVDQSLLCPAVLEGPPDLTNL